MVAKAEKGGEGTNWVLGISRFRLLHIEWINNKVLFTCRGIGPHLAGSGKSYGFSRLAAGTWGIFSSYSGDVHSKL